MLELTWWQGAIYLMISGAIASVGWLVQGKGQFKRDRASVAKMIWGEVEKRNEEGMQHKADELVKLYLEIFKKLEEGKTLNREKK